MTTPEWIKLYLKNGRTFAYLRKHHPLEGIGFFCELLMLLANTPNHTINFNDEVDREYLLDHMNISEKKAREQCAALVTTGKLNADLWEAGILFMEDCVDSLSEFYRRKKTDPPRLVDILSTYCRQPDGNMSPREKRGEEKEERDATDDGLRHVADWKNSHR